MTDMNTMIATTLSGIGIGESRIQTVMNGAELFGRTGILNSLELVQFIAELSEASGLDVFEFMEGLDVSQTNIFSNITELTGFLTNRLSKEAAA